MGDGGESLFLRPAQYMGGGYFTNSADDPFVLDLHRHEQISEMLLIEEGAGEFLIGERTYEVGAGTLLLYQRGVWHKERSTRYPFRATYLAYSGLQLRGLPEHDFLPPGCEPAIALGDAHPLFVRRMSDVIEAWDAGEAERKLMTQNLLSIVLIMLARRVHSPAQHDPAALSAGRNGAVAKARRYMEENYRLPITLDTLSTLTYTNKYHLAHLFKEEAGISPIQFLIACRMEAARHYLLSTSLAVKQIAELVGYRSEPSFYKVFMKMNGMTPVQYRHAATIGDADLW